MDNIKKLFSKIKMFNYRYIKNLYNITIKPEMRILPGSIAFFLVMSIVPTIIIAAITCSKFSISISDLLKLFEHIIPSQVEDLLKPIANSSSSNFSIWLLLLGLILASNGPHAIILASNTLYGIKNGNYITRRIKALILTIILMCLFTFILVVLAFGNSILKFVLSLPIFVEIADDIFKVFVVLKWPTAIIVISLLIKVLYTIAPDARIKSKYVNKGVIFTTMGWVIATALYSYYANNISNYDIIYGSLSNIVILMLWIYVISYILVLGIAINTNIYKIENEELNKN